MALKFIDGFDQYQGQSQGQLLSSLAAAGYTVSTGMAMADSRKSGGYALELLVSSGAAGTSWSSRTNNVKVALRGVASSAAGRTIAVGDNANAVGTDDGVNWLPVTLGITASMRAIECHNTTWIMVGLNGAIMRSTDGKNFTTRPAPVSGVNLAAVAYGGTRWVAVGSSGAVGAIWVSDDDGVTWGTIASGGLRANACVAYGNDSWCVGGAGGQVLTSADGAAWEQRLITGGGSITGIEPYGVDWLAAGGSNIYRSANSGVSWTTLATSVITGASILSMAQSDGRLMVCGGNGSLRMSDDGATWTKPSLTGVGITSLNCVAPTKGVSIGWVLVGAMNTAQSGVNQRAVIQVALSPATTLSRSFTTTSDLFTIGFAHRSTARGKIFSISGVLEMDWPAAIDIGEVTGTVIPARNVWYYYEVTIDKAALTATVHINNVSDLVVPLDAGVAVMTNFDVIWTAENGAVTRLDDVYFVDQTAPNGETLVDRLGPIAIPLRMPDADVITEWQTASGTEHWPQVGLLPPSTESFIRSSASGAQDLFTSSTPLPEDAGTIFAVGVLALAQKGDIDNRQLGLTIGIGPTQKEVLDTVLAVVPEYSMAIFETAQEGAPWTAENVLATPFGVVVRP